MRLNTKTLQTITTLLLLGSAHLALGSSTDLAFSGRCQSSHKGKAMVYSDFDIILECKDNHGSAYMDFHIADEDGNYSEHTVRAELERTTAGVASIAFELRAPSVLLNGAWLDDVKIGTQITFRQSLPAEKAIYCRGTVNAR